MTIQSTSSRNKKVIYLVWVREKISFVLIHSTKKPVNNEFTGF